MLTFSSSCELFCVAKWTLPSRNQNLFNRFSFLFSVKTFTPRTWTTKNFKTSTSIWNRCRTPESRTVTWTATRTTSTMLNYIARDRRTIIIRRFHTMYTHTKFSQFMHLFQLSHQATWQIHDCTLCLTATSQTFTKTIATMRLQEAPEKALENGGTENLHQTTAQKSTWIIWGKTGILLKAIWSQ